MAVNVAELVATIALRVEGMNQAVSAVESLTRAQAALQTAASSTSATVTDLANKLGDAVAEVEAFEAAVASAPSQIRMFEQQASAAGAEVVRLTARMEKLKKEQQEAFTDRDVARYRELGQELAKVRAAMSNASNEQIGASQAADTLGSLTPEVVMRRRVELLAGVEKGTKNLERATKPSVEGQRKLANSFRLSNGEMGAFFLQLARGQASLGAFTSLIGRTIMAIPKMAAVLAAVAVVLGPVIIGFKLLGGELAKMSQQMEQRNITAPLSADLKKLRDDLNLTTIAFQDFYEKGRNNAQSQGIVDAAGFAESQMAAAGNLRFLSSDRDPSKAIQAVNSAVSGQTGALADYGLNVGEINRQLANLPPEADAATRSMTILNAVNAQLAQNQDKIIAANAKSATSFEDLSVAGTKIKEVFAQSLAPVIADFVKWLEDMLRRGAPAIAAVGVAITFMAAGSLNVLKVLVAGIESFMGMWEKAGTIIVAAIKTIFPPLGILINILDFFTPDGAFAGIRDEFEAMQESIAGFASEIGGAVPDIRGFAPEIEKIGDSFQEMRNKISGGFSVVDTLRGVGDALHAINEEGLDSRTAFGLVQAMDSKLNAALDGGVEKVAALQAELVRLKDTGFLSSKEFEEANKILELAQTSLAPYEQAAENIKRQMGGVSDTAISAQGEIATVRTDLEAINGMRSTAFIDIVTTQHGMVGNFGNLGRSFGRAGNFGNLSGGGGPPGMVGRAGATLPSAGGPPGSNLGRNRGRGADMDAQKKMASDMAASRKADEEIAAIMRGPAGGGGGGGGGGGASIGDIRKFFREMNKLIKIGVNGGVAFSTAGNTMPLGGRGDFLNRSGGTLIETVNIRGIWDFTDPGQKKQIIRELEQALRNLKRGQN